MKTKAIFSLLVALAILVLIIVFKLFSSASDYEGISQQETVVGGLKYYHKSKNEIDKRTIYVLNKIRQEKRVLYQTSNTYVDQISLSSNRKFIAAIETEGFAKSGLLIVNPKGKIVKVIGQDVRKYVWSPDGDKIAYITGKYSEDGMGFLSSGLYLFDLNNGQVTQIAPKAYYVNWVNFDSCVYYYDLRKVFRYDPATEKTKETVYYGINFSPDGKYYTTSSSEEDYEIYSVKTNQPIASLLSLKLKDLEMRPNWAPNFNHHLLIIKNDYEIDPRDTADIGKPRLKRILGIKQTKYEIYDIEKDKIIKEWIEKPEK